VRNYYTGKEEKQILKSMTILVDTRENANNHITDYFDKKKVKYKNKKLDYGDYSFMLPENKELGILKPIFFDNEIVVERKNSLTELSGNLTKDRTRFEQELIKKNGAKFHLMVEDGSWEMIENQKYGTEYKPKSFIATLNAYIARYDISIDFISKDHAGSFIARLFHYHLREVMKNYVTDSVQ
jgi:ERCC4-type nuclease